MGQNAQTRWWVENKVGYIVMENPPMNVRTPVIVDGTLQALDEFKAAGVLAVVLTGAGDRAFCAGADLKEEERLTKDTVGAFQSRGAAMNEALRNCEAPIIGAINGYAMGGGLVLALWCDIRIGSTNAKLGAVGVKVGLIASNVQLQRLLGEGRARDAVLTGRTIGAEEALRLGLLSKVVPPDQLMAEATAWAQMIAERAPLAVSRAKWMINHALDFSKEEAEARERELWLECERSKDHKEAIAAFFEKRKPVFRGE